MWYFPYKKSIPLNTWPRAFLMRPFSVTYIKLQKMPKISEIPIDTSRFNVLEYYDKFIQDSHVGSLLNLSQVLSSFACFVSESALHVAPQYNEKCDWVHLYFKI